MRFSRHHHPKQMKRSVYTAAITAALEKGQPGMALISDTPRREPIPHEPEQWFEFRDLGYADMTAARNEKKRENQRELREMGPELYIAMMRQNQATRTVQVGDPINTHDVLTLLDRGVVAWSYRESLPPSTPETRRARLETLGRLDQKTAEWAARVLMAQAGVDNAWGQDTGILDAESHSVDEDETHIIALDARLEEENPYRRDPLYASSSRSTGT